MSIQESSGAILTDSFPTSFSAIGLAATEVRLFEFDMFRMLWSETNEKGEWMFNWDRMKLGGIFIDREQEWMGRHWVQS